MQEDFKVLKNYIPMFYLFIYREILGEKKGFLGTLYESIYINSLSGVNI